MLASSRACVLWKYLRDAIAIPAEREKNAAVDVVHLQRRSTHAKMIKEPLVKVNRARSYRVQTWLDEREYKHFQGIVEKSGLAKEHCMRQLIMSGIVKPQKPVEYLRLIAEVNMIGNNINQIARVGNVDGRISPESIAECKHLQKRIVEMLRNQLL